METETRPRPLVEIVAAYFSGPPEEPARDTFADAHDFMEEIKDSLEQHEPRHLDCTGIPDEAIIEFQKRWRELAPQPSFDFSEPRLEPIDDPEVAGQAIVSLANTIKILKRNVANLLKRTGQAMECRGPNCSAAVWMVRDGAGKCHPFNGDGTSHFATCPDAKQFRGGK